MKKILLATVAVVPLLAAGMSPASAQDIKQQGKEGVSQSSPARTAGPESRSHAQGKEIQGKSEAADKVGQNSGAREKTEGKAQAKTEPGNGGPASSDRAARQDKSKDQAGSESSKQALGSKAKQGADELNGRRPQQWDKSKGPKHSRAGWREVQPEAGQPEAGQSEAGQSETGKSEASGPEAGK